VSTFTASNITLSHLKRWRYIYISKINIKKFDISSTNGDLHALKSLQTIFVGSDKQRNYNKNKTNEMIYSNNSPNDHRHRTSDVGQWYRQTRAIRRCCLCTGTRAAASAMAYRDLRRKQMEQKSKVNTEAQLQTFFLLRFIYIYISDNVPGKSISARLSSRMPLVNIALFIIAGDQTNNQSIVQFNSFVMKKQHRM
jgi:hypothetical protein